MSKLRIYFALGITVFWAASYIVSVAMSDYTGVSFVTPIMLMAAGYLLGTGLKDRNGNGNGKR